LCYPIDAITGVDVINAEPATSDVIRIAAATATEPAQNVE